jgi:hypothetical protein
VLIPACSSAIGFGWSGTVSIAVRDRCWVMSCFASCSSCWTRCCAIESSVTWPLPVQWQRAPRPPIRIGIAAAVQVSLGQRVGLERFRRALGIDERHFQCLRDVERGAGQLEAHAEDDDCVHQHREGCRDLDTGMSAQYRNALDRKPPDGARASPRALRGERRRAPTGMARMPRAAPQGYDVPIRQGPMGLIVAEHQLSA